MSVRTIAIFCLLLAILVVYATLTTPFAIERDILGYFAAQRSTFADALFHRITWAGSFYVLAPLCLLASYLLARRQWRTEAGLLLGGFFLSTFLARVLKYLIGRERPDLYPAMVDSFTTYGFPSSHAAQISAFALALFLVLPGIQGGWRVTLGVTLLLLGIIVMISRLYLQVHYPSDVLAGAVLGVLCVATVARFTTLRTR